MCPDSSTSQHFNSGFPFSKCIILLPQNMRLCDRTALRIARAAGRLRAWPVAWPLWLVSPSCALPSVGYSDLFLCWSVCSVSQWILFYYFFYRFYLWMFVYDTSSWVHIDDRHPHNVYFSFYFLCEAAIYLLKYYSDVWTLVLFQYVHSGKRGFIDHVIKLLSSISYKYATYYIYSLLYILQFDVTWDEVKLLSCTSFLFSS